MKKSYTIAILILLIVLPVTSQTIEKFSLVSGGSSTTINGIEILYTIREVVVQEISTATVLVSEGFINPSFDASLSIDDNQLSHFNISVYPNPTR